ELEMTKGTGTVVGRVSYMEQSPWIMNDTMRANIIFGREFDEEYYWQVLHACALTHDIKAWPSGDLTLIGERGINISGGQRARLALARTVYSRADIYMLDDPLSAVDAHVKRHILDNVILSSGLLGNKLRVITTHSESMLPFCNQVVTVSDKTTSVVRQEPKEHKFIAPVMVTEHNDESDLIPKDTNMTTAPVTPTTNSDNMLVTSAITPDTSPSSAKLQTLPEKYTLLDNSRYMSKLCGWHLVTAVVISASFRPIVKFILDGYNIAALKENAKSHTVSHDAVLWYLKINTLEAATSIILRMLENYVSSLLSEHKAEDAIQEKFVRSLLYAPLSFIEKADRHTVVPAYNSGSRIMTNGIPEYLRSESANAIKSILSIWRSALATPQFAIIVPFVIWAQASTSRLTDTMASSLRNIRMEINARQAKTSSVINGGSLMIRLFGVESYYMSRYLSEKDEGGKVTVPYLALNFLSNFVSMGIREVGNMASIFSVVAQSYLTSHKVSSGQLKVLRDDMSGLIANISVLVGVPSRLKEFSDDISTFRQFSDIKAEAPYIVEDNRVPSEWPRSGCVEFKNLSVKYGADQNYALKNLKVTIRPGEKIGIVGRTGAGKSTLAKAIFRLLNENVEGSIEIDGCDTAKFGVGDFRPKLGIIPQESTMFRGTVGRNLDPLHEFTIEDMWAAMIKSGVAELIEPERKRGPIGSAKESSSTGGNGDDNDEESSFDRGRRLRWERAGLLMRAVLLVFDRKPKYPPQSYFEKAGINYDLNPNDSNFSSGQQQLFSLCRLLMRKRKVLVLDEATADVDLETDRKIQELIRSEFRECTVLTIAHRLDTIMNSDRVIVMEKGEVAEIGPPQELIANGGMFAELVKANEF
ncbi:Multidrug resistance-associated protein 1, partial [Coemansia sp. RSA 2673]